MQNNPIITLTSDFGYKDPFVGMMKGVILSINPLAKIIDITHGISPHNIKEAALTIGMSHSFFPPKTVHVVVVDPGVGSSRRPILVITDHAYFIGPDNGVFSLIYNSKNETLKVIHLTSEHYFMPDKGPTFHGRDIFSPAAAWLTKGIESVNFGEAITDYVTLHFPSASRPEEKAVEGEVIYIDRFGNAITNIKALDLNMLYGINPEGKIKIIVKERHTELRSHYSQVPDKGLYALVNSTEYLELFTYKGNASSVFDIKVGDVVRVILSDVK
ncbi:MAG: SAM-dependent chlorinase/fluorinase [Nitrospirae bacterium]|nr:SAM-dependent chlorinase/fluorinase [Nitrospirota bacterium]